MTPSQRLRDLIEEASGGLPENLELWRERARAQLVRHYGDPDHPEVKRFVGSLVPNLVHSEATVASGEFAQAQFESLQVGVAQLEVLAEELETHGAIHHEGVNPSPGDQEAPDSQPDERVVWVVHGRNLAARDGMFTFLRALGLKPLEWDQAVGLTGKGAPYVGEVLDRAFDSARAVVVLMTPDEVAYLRQDLASGAHDPETEPASQARPNVLFEAGMALGRHPERTVIVEMGHVRPFSDVAGRHVVRLDGSSESRKALAQRIQSAGVAVDMTGSDWLSAGDLSPPAEPGGGYALGKRVPAQDQVKAVRLDARYHSRSRGGRLEIINRGTRPVYNVDIDVPEEAGPSFSVMTHDLPINVLPPGKSVFLVTSRSIGPGRDHFVITITGQTDDGMDVSEEAFVSLLS